MVMALTVSESGCVFHLKRPGAILNAGDTIARLELDDSSRITRAQAFTGGFPPSKTPLPREDEKLNHIYHTCRTVLDNILSGECSYCWQLWWFDNSGYILFLEQDLVNLRRFNTFRNITGKIDNVDSPQNFMNFLNETTVIVGQTFFFLLGFCLPDEFFTSMVKETVQKLMCVLRDPNLPLLELQVKLEKRVLL